MTEWKKYKRKGYAIARPYIPGEDLTDISVAQTDREAMARGEDFSNAKICVNENDLTDKWMVAPAYWRANFEQDGEAIEVNG